MNTLIPIKEIIKKAGGPAVIAKKCSITSQAVSQWKKVPPIHVPTISQMSGLSGSEIRPDMYPDSEDNQAA